MSAAALSTVLSTAAFSAASSTIGKGPVTQLEPYSLPENLPISLKVLALQARPLSLSALFQHSLFEMSLSSLASPGTGLPEVPDKQQKLQST